MDRCDPGPDVLLVDQTQAPSPLLDRLGRNQVQDRNLDPRLAEQAIRLPVLITVDHAPIRIGGVGRDPGDLQRLRVHSSEMTGDVPEMHRVLRRHRIQVPPGEVTLLLEAEVIVSVPLDPSPRRLRRRPLPDLLEDVSDCPIGGRGAVDLEDRVRPRAHMTVRVDKTRKQRPPTEIQNTRRSRRGLPHLGVGAHRDDPPRLDRHPLSPRPRWVHRHHIGVDQHDISTEPSQLTQQSPRIVRQSHSQSVASTARRHQEVYSTNSMLCMLVHVGA